MFAFDPSDPGVMGLVFLVVFVVGSVMGAAGLVLAGRRRNRLGPDGW
jgi:hypothetical protein